MRWNANIGDANYEAQQRTRASIIQGRRHSSSTLPRLTIAYLLLVRLTMLPWARHPGMRRAHRAAWHARMTRFGNIMLIVGTVQLFYYTAADGAAGFLGWGIIFAAMQIIWRKVTGLYAPVWDDIADINLPGSPIYEGLAKLRPAYVLADDTDVDISKVLEAAHAQGEQEAAAWWERAKPSWERQGEGAERRRAAEANHRQAKAAAAAELGAYPQRYLVGPEVRPAPHSHRLPDGTRPPRRPTDGKPASVPRPGDPPPAMTAKHWQDQPSPYGGTPPLPLADPTGAVVGLTGPRPLGYAWRMVIGREDTPRLNAWAFGHEGCLPPIHLFWTVGGQGEGGRCRCRLLTWDQLTDAIYTDAGAEDPDPCRNGHILTMAGTRCITCGASRR
jgi:hypothetical protein